MAEALCPSPLDAATKRGFIQFHGAESTGLFLLSKGFLPQAKLSESFAERLCEPRLLFGLEVHCLLLEFFLIFCLDNLNWFLFCFGKLHVPDQFFLGYFTEWRHPKGVRTVTLWAGQKVLKCFCFLLGYRVRVYLLL